MKLKKYKKDDLISYSFGAFPTMELIKNRCNMVDRILIHSSFKNMDVLDEMKKYIDESKIEYDKDKEIEKISDKGNEFVIGIFSKYEMNLDKELDHLLLDNPSNMGNLGTIIRSSLGFNIKNIAIIRPGVDYFDPKVIRSSMGSLFSVNIKNYNSLEEYKNEFKEHTIYSFMLQANKSLRNEDFNNKYVTLAFGNEATGLDKKYLNEHSLIIKYLNKIDSLNITNAVSIALYEYNEKKNM